MSQSPEQLYDVGVIIPVYRATPALPKLLAELARQLARLHWHAYLVDDSDQPETHRYLLQNCLNRNTTVIQLSYNSGQQNAILCGVRTALPHCKTFVCMDDDGQHPAGMVPRLLAALTPKNSLVYGISSRPTAGFRGLGSKARDLLFRCCFSLPRSVTVSSFRAFTPEVAAAVSAFQGSFFYFSAVALAAKPQVQCVHYQPRCRLYGKSGYTFRKLITLYLHIVQYYLLRCPQPCRELYQVASITEGSQP